MCPAQRKELMFRRKYRSICNHYKNGVNIFGRNDYSCIDFARVEYCCLPNTRKVGKNKNKICPPVFQALYSHNFEQFKNNCKNI